jgi:hypothetical protein
MNTQPANRTRRTIDLPARFRAEGRWFLIPLYHLLRRSDFAREGIENSGSYRFADHLYRGKPSGRGWFGRALDRLLLNLPAARGMRSRCAKATAELEVAWQHRPEARPFRVLTVPCGLPREVRDFVAEPDREAVSYTGLDIDPEVIVAAKRFVESSPLDGSRFLCGNALEAASWPQEQFDFISSTGLGEFLDDDPLRQLYTQVHAHLASGGAFFTSATACEPRADWVLRAIELETHYRTQHDLARLLAGQPWRKIEYSHDATGLQTFVRAVKA